MRGYIYCLSIKSKPGHYKVSFMTTAVPQIFESMLDQLHDDFNYEIGISVNQVEKKYENMKHLLNALQRSENVIPEIYDVKLHHICCMIRMMDGQMFYYKNSGHQSEEDEIDDIEIDDDDEEDDDKEDDDNDDEYQEDDQDDPDYRDVKSKRPSRKKFNSEVFKTKDFRDYLLDGEVVIAYKKQKFWEGVYNKSENVIVRKGVKYFTMSKFYRDFLTKSFSRKFAEHNGWNYIKVIRNGKVVFGRNITKLK